ncbi:MAG: hypothetical protein BJ554DRAFT_1462 [Olpidium bornovanus]|uniref:MTHFR SAM-binding regulatory domain-containing protein n=1 Tax=Olpidium bornovanus TaxID=278681 RepID=A0A8H8DHF5_9FUNG|nr:MAG: hypothetical protein BJ554DRAFT_1462 [Olpidium bornovanus]
MATAYHSTLRFVIDVLKRCWLDSACYLRDLLHALRNFVKSAYGPPLKLPRCQPKEALRIWGSPKTLDDLGSLFASYCLCELRTLPWSPDPLLPESRSVAARLAELNRMHLFTVGSQPAVDGVANDDPIVGWGPRVRGTQGWVYQKAFVEFFVAPDRAATLLDRLRRSEKVTYYAGSLQVGAHDGCETNASKDARNAVTWGVFVGQEIVQPTIVDEPAFMAWKLLSEIHRTWWLVNVVYDDYKTGQDALFDLLVSSLSPAHGRS